MDPDFRREVKAAVTAGLIITAILAVGGLLYSALKGLSLIEFLEFVAIPASALGFIVSLAAVAVALVRMLQGLIEMCSKLEQGLERTTKRLGEAEDRLGRQVAETAYGEIIAEAKADGWTLAAGERGALHFSHPQHGTAEVSGSEEIDPDRLRFLLSVGRSVPAIRERSDD